ncbi:hypothetical protein [Xanthovirga aplysinae]|nr:hypothetical protein [Xanthovirga aplysinae]
MGSPNEALKTAFLRKMNGNTSVTMIISAEFMVSKKEVSIKEMGNIVKY